jgi:hypothetical protein
MQPVLVHKLEEEYVPPIGMTSKTSAVTGQVLVKGDGNGVVQESKAKMYQSATATGMYMMQWSHPDTFNAVRRLAWYMTAPREAPFQALMTLIRYVISTENRGLVLVPKEKWSPKYMLLIHGRSDSDYTRNTDEYISISNGRVFMNGAPTWFRSAIQKFVTLSVTEGKTAAGVMVAQDMVDVYCLLDLLKLSIKLPVVLEMDNP